MCSYTLSYLENSEDVPLSVFLGLVNLLHVDALLFKCFNKQIFSLKSIAQTSYEKSLTTERYYLNFP